MTLKVDTMRNIFLVHRSLNPLDTDSLPRGYSVHNVFTVIHQHHFHAPRTDLDSVWAIHVKRPIPFALMRSAAYRLEHAFPACTQIAIFGLQDPAFTPHPPPRNLGGVSESSISAAFGVNAFRLVLTTNACPDCFHVDSDAGDLLLYTSLKSCKYDIGKICSSPFVFHSYRAPSEGISHRPNMFLRSRSCDWQHGRAVPCI
jgi:hypothetical protein